MRSFVFCLRSEVSMPYKILAGAVGNTLTRKRHFAKSHTVS